MGKQYSIDDIKNLHGNLTFNYNPINEAGEKEYYVAAIIFGAQAEGNNARTDGENTITFGNPQATPFTLKEIYQGIKSKMGLNTANCIKDLVLNLTDDDIS